MLEINGLDSDPLQSIGNTDVPVITFEQRAANILRNMLRTVLGYSGDKAEAIYLYIQKNENSVNLDTLYGINGGLYEAHKLNKAKTEEKFDTSIERQQELLKFLAEDLTGELLPLFEKNDKAFPDEIWASFDLSENFQKTVFGYSSGEVLPVVDSMKKWAAEIRNPNEALSWVTDNVQIPEIPTV